MWGEGKEWGGCGVGGMWGGGVRKGSVSENPAPCRRLNGRCDRISRNTTWLVSRAGGRAPHGQS